MKIGDKYKCKKTYHFNESCYFIENNIFTVAQIFVAADQNSSQVFFDHDDFNDGELDDSDESMFMFFDEMDEYFSYVPPFKFGK